METAEGNAHTQRPKEVTIGVATLAALYAYGFYGAIVAGLFADMSRAIGSGLLIYLVTPLLILGMWFGWGAARIVDAALLIAGLVALARLPNPGLALLAKAVHAAALALLFLPVSNAWFRSRKPQFKIHKRHPLYPFALAVGIVFGIPLLLVLVAIVAGPMLSVLGIPILLALAVVFFIPALIFGPPHFSVNIFAGPADAMGWVLMIVFYAFVAVALGACLWLMRDPEPGQPRRGGWVIVAVLLGLLALMIVPQLGDRSALSAKLQEKVVTEQARLDAAVAADYPQLEGTFTILDERWSYGVRSTGHWKIAKATLEIVADSTQIWNRFPQCTNCAALKGWRFTLISADKPRGPRLGARERQSGFAWMTDATGSGPDGRTTVTGHRMVVPIAEDATMDVYLGGQQAEGKILKAVPPDVLAYSWLGIELEFKRGGSSQPVSMTNPFLFADALAEKGLAPARCAAPSGIPDAVERGCHEELARMLADPARRAGIEKGDKNLRVFSRELSPLEIAVRKNDAKAATLLLANGANPNQTDVTGYTILMNAVRHDADDVVAVLARHKAKIDQQYANPGQDAGKTALIMAAVAGRTEAIRALLAAGANKSIKTRTGYTAYDHAVQFRHPEAAALLR